MLQLATKARIREWDLSVSPKHWRENFFSFPALLFSFLLVLSFFPPFFLSSFSGQRVASPSPAPKLNHYKQVHLTASVKNQKLVRCNDDPRRDTYGI